jgi:outer membrane protein assembly factor BamB
LFSSFAVHNYNEDKYCVAFGCSDGCIYCLDETGFPLWTTNLGGRITSTPFIFQYTSMSKNLNGHLLAVVSAPKQFTLVNCTSGKIVVSYELPYETFSSPVIAKNLILIGSRDNYLYCFNL